MKTIGNNAIHRAANSNETAAQRVQRQQASIARSFNVSKANCRTTPLKSLRLVGKADHSGLLSQMISCTALALSSAPRPARRVSLRVRLIHVSWTIL